MNKTEVGLSPTEGSGGIIISFPPVSAPTGAKCLILRKSQTLLMVMKNAVIVIFVSYCYCDKLAQTLCLKATYLLSYSSGEQKSEMGLTQLKPRCQQNFVPSGASGGDPLLVFSVSDRLPTSLGSWLHHANLCFHHHFFSDSGPLVSLLHGAL